MINLIQSPEVKAPVVANLQRLGLGDPPLHQRIAVLRIVLAPMGFISSNADMVQSVFLLFKPVDLFGNQVRLELASTPAHFHSRPAIAGQRLAHSDTAFNGPLLLLGNIKHQPLKTMGMPQGGDMDAALPVEKIIQLGNMGLHLRKFHGRIRIEYAVNGHILFNHQQQERTGVLPAGHRN